MMYRAPSPRRRAARHVVELALEQHRGAHRARDQRREHDPDDDDQHQVGAPQGRERDHAGDDQRQRQERLDERDRARRRRRRGSSPSPARAPFPSTVPSSVASGAMIRMSREPTITRENMSRPSWSVPNRCALDGALLMPSRFWAYGSCGAISRAEDRADDPERAARARRSRTSASAAARDQISRRATWRPAWSAPADSTATSAIGSFGGPQADARVQQRERDVGDQRHHHVDDADRQHARLEHRDVLLVGGVVGQQADAVVAEQELDDDEPADQVAGLRGDHRDRRQQRVAQHVAADHHAARQALERRRPRVVGLERLDRPDAGHARDVAEQDQHQRDHRQDQVLQRGEEPRARRRGGRHRQPLEPDREDQDQDDPRHELGHGQGRLPDDRDRPVERLAELQRGEHAADDAQRHDDDEREHRELQRPPQRAPSGSGRSAPDTVGGPGEVRDPVPVLRSTGLSTPSWWSSALTALGAASGPRIERPGSPGRIWPAKNTIRLRIHSVISARPSRLRMNAVTPGDLSPWTRC